MKKIGIISLGCPRNLVDSEEILGRLKLKGFKITDLNKAQVGLVNTCAFIDEAKQESIDTILGLVKLKKDKLLEKIIVYGCLVQRYGDKLRRELPEVDAFVGRVELEEKVDRFPLTPKHFAYLKICESCLNRCSYCVIPHIKGKFKSLSEELLLKKAQSLVRSGVVELNIVGQDSSGYGVDLYKKYHLASLVRRICKEVEAVQWVRLLYLYPSRVNDELLEVIRSEPKVCKYLDLPIQHINRKVLELMNRHTNPQDIKSLIDRVRLKVPGIALRTSIITGFPQETEAAFKELCGFVSQVKFERLGVFIYSAQEGTQALKLKGQIPKKVKLERFNHLMQLQQAVALSVNKQFLHRKMEVIIDEKDTQAGEGRYLGRTRFDAPEVDGQVYVHSKTKLKPGMIVPVEITDTLEYDLVGEALR